MDLSSATTSGSSFGYGTAEGGASYSAPSKGSQVTQRSLLIGFGTVGTIILVVLVLVIIWMAVGKCTRMYCDDSGSDSKHATAATFVRPANSFVSQMQKIADKASDFFKGKKPATATGNYAAQRGAGPVGAHMGTNPFNGVLASPGYTGGGARGGAVGGAVGDTGFPLSAQGPVEGDRLPVAVPGVGPAPAHPGEHLPFPLPNTMASATGVGAAQAIAAASARYASTVNGAVQGGGQTASPADIQRVADDIQGVNGAQPLGPMFQQLDGPYLSYEQPTTMQPLAGVHEPWNDSTKLLQFLDPKGAAQLEQALSLSATPKRFFATEADARAIQAEERAKYWRRNGKLDLSAEELLDDRPVWVPTAAAIRQSVLGNGVDRTVAVGFPRRFAYPDMPGGRMATPRVVFDKDSVIQEPMLPGYDVQLSSQACNTCLLQTMEPL